MESRSVEFRSLATVAVQPMPGNTKRPALTLIHRTPPHKPDQLGGRTFGFLRNPRAPNGGRGDPKSSPAKVSAKAGKCALIHR